MNPLGLSPELFITHDDLGRPIRRGDVVKFFVRSCVPYSHVNTVLSSSKAIYSSKRHSFTSQMEGAGVLDEVVEIKVPHNVTEGSLTLTVNGINHLRTESIPKELYSASIKLYVIVFTRTPQINIVDQVHDDFSTTVTFRLDGLPNNSVLSIQAAKVASLNKQETEFDSSEYFPGVSNASPGWRARNEIKTVSNVPFNNYRRTSSGNKDHPLIFFDVDRKTATEDGKAFVVTKTFDHLTEHGTYVVSAATFNPESGRTQVLNSPVLKIFPPPLTLSLSVAPSVILGETAEVLGSIKNNHATPFKGRVSLHVHDERSTNVTDLIVEVQPYSSRILTLQVTPFFLGDVVVSLSSNISSRLTSSKKIKVTPEGSVKRISKFFLREKRHGIFNVTSKIRKITFELHPNCKPIGHPSTVVLEDDILGDMFTFVQDDLFALTSSKHELWLPRLRMKILTTLGFFYGARKDDGAVQKIVKILGNSEQDITGLFEAESIADLTSKLVLAVSPFPIRYGFGQQSKHRWEQLTAMQQADGSFISTPSMNGTLGFVNGNHVVDTALALLAIRKVNGSELGGNKFTYSSRNFERGVEFLQKVTFGRHLRDHFPLSIVAYLFSQLDVPESPKIFRRLEGTASNNTSGMFWTSNWYGNRNLTTKLPSIAATSFALMTYVEMRKTEQASEIARWLISKKNSEGLFGTFQNTAVAVESLSRYATLLASQKGEWPSLVKMTQTCYTPRRNVSTGKHFLLEATVGKNGGVLRLRTCAGEDQSSRLMILEVSLPSGFVKESRRGRVRSDGSVVLLATPGKCVILIAYRMKKISNDYGTGGPPKGSVSYFDLKEPHIRGVLFFEAIRKEADFDTEDSQG